MNPNPFFSLEEYRLRLAKTKEAMYRQGIEVLLVTDPANINYLSGYDGWSFYVHQGLIVLMDRIEPIWFGRMQDSNGAKLTTWLSDDSVRGYQDHYVQSNLRHPMDFVCDLLEEHQAEKRRLGVEMDNYYFTGKCLEALSVNLGQAEIMDANLLVNWVRFIKSPAEIGYMRMAARIVEKVMRAAVLNISEGVREGDAAGEVVKAQLSGTDDFTGDYASIMPIMPSGIRTSTAHLSWVDRRYEKGDLVLLELAGNVHRYHAPLSRTLIIGKPPKELLDVAQGVIGGLNKVLDFIRPGVTGEEVEECWRKAISGTKVVKESRMGYSFGCNYPPDWGEHTLSLRPGDKTVLAPGATIHVMPGVWLDEFGFECSEPIVVTEKGCECLADYPRELIEK
ncbi:MAG: M24 family metallopeptidase [Deltaproteobacteria bacterium]|jgi:Xaa-Pro dipeptidase|nr:M24 family metallopeptidase [Deltaproteobacteria bacterium]